MCEAIVLRPVFELARVCNEIFYWLRAKHFPKYFKDKHEWMMTQFHLFLTDHYHHDVEADGAPDALRAVVIENLLLYMEEVDEFRPSIGNFVDVVSFLLRERMKFGGKLVVTAANFLTTIARQYANTMSQDIVNDLFTCVSYLCLHGDSEEFFTWKPIEFIKRDL